MSRVFKKERDGRITVSVNFKFEGSFLEMEEDIQKTLNELGLQATLEALKTFDTDGSPIEVSGEHLTSKGSQKKTFQRPME